MIIRSSQPDVIGTPRDVLRDDHAERVGARTRPADAIGHPDHAHRDDRVHPHCQAHADDDWDQRHVFLAHADRESADAEDEQATADQYPGACAQALDRIVQGRIDGAGLAKDLDDAPRDKDQEDNVLCRGKPVGNSHQEMPGRQGDCVVFARVVEGVGDHHFAVGVVGIGLPVELSLRHHVAQELGNHDDREDQDERIERPAALFHAAPLLFCVFLVSLPCSLQ